MNKRKVQIVVFYTAQSQNKTYLVLKTNKKRGMFWQNITGGVDKGEDFKSAAIREFQEETSIHPDNIKNITETNLFFEFHDRWGKDVYEKVYVIELSQKYDITIDPHEHCDFQWVNDISKLQKMMKYSSNYDAINLVQENL